MAIQLARAIGMQGAIPQSNVPQLIQKIGSDIASNIEKAGERKEKKAEKEQALKDAMSANIKYEPIEATPDQQREYEDYARKGLSELAVLRANPSVTSAQFQSKKDEFEYGLGERKIKYKTDFDTLLEAKKRKNEGTHYTEDFENYLIGTPDREEIIQPENKLNAPYREKSMLSTEEEAPENIAEPEKRIVKGETGYFQLPFEEQKKRNLREELENRSVIADTDALKAAQGYFGGDYTPRIHVGITTTSKGATEFNVNEKGLEADAQKYAISFIGDTNYTKEHNIKKRNYENAAIKALKENDLPLTAENIANYTARMAYNDFKIASDVAIKDEIRKQREARATKGGMTFNFGQGETKKDTYIQEENYNTDPIAESMYSNVTYLDRFEKFKQRNKESLAKEYNKDYAGSLKEDEYYKKRFDEELEKQDATREGKTIREGWVEKEKESLRKYEGNTAVSFNNKTEENVPLNVTRGGRQVVRQYIPSKLLYDKNGNITGVEAYAATKTADENYWKKTDSVEIIPMTKENLNTIKSNFPELLPYIEQNFKVKLKYSEATTKPAAQKTTSSKSRKETADAALQGF